MNDYYKKVTAFLEEYLDFKRPEAYTSDEILSLTYIKIGFEKLLEARIYINEKQIKQQALKKYNIILKDEFFNYSRGSY